MSFIYEKEGNRSLVIHTKHKILRIKLLPMYFKGFEDFFPSCFKMKKRNEEFRLSAGHLLGMPGRGFTGGRRPPTSAASPGPTSEEADEANLSTDLVFPHKTLKESDL